jgi:hypothetical protein
MQILDIFGCSDKILDLKLPQKIETESLGLNAFPLYHKTDFWLWMDNKEHGNCVYKKENDKYIPYLRFEPNYDPEKDLFGSYTVATFGIDFAIKQGYKKVRLFGILDGSYNLNEEHVLYKHFYNDKLFKMHINNLKAWKDTIYSYKNSIEIEIPYQTF